MKCGICGSKKNVRWFEGKTNLYRGRGFTECRNCFEMIANSPFAYGVSKKDIEEEWERGLEHMPKMKEVRNEW